jgi:hypothetical protein
MQKMHFAFEPPADGLFNFKSAASYEKLVSE